MRHLALGLLFVAAVCAPALAAPLEKLEKREAPAFIRVEEENGEVVTLQTAIAHYRSPANSVEVDLISAIHVADARYFRELQERMKRYDVVLYELVAPPDRLIPDRTAQANNPLAMLQELMTDVLGFEHQLHGVDYTAKNFVHADLSPDGMQKALEARGETPISIMLGVAADVIRSGNVAANQSSSAGSSAASAGDEFDKFVEVATDPDGTRTIKRQLARQFASAETLGGMPKAIEASLIHDRNAAAMKVFDEQLKKRQAGRSSDGPPLRIGIFYGAAHNADFHRRLLADYPLEPAGVEWVTAWNMRSADTTSPAVRFLYNSLGDALRELMRQP